MPTSTISETSVLSVKELGHRYDNVEVLQGVSFDLNRGQMLAVRGDSGSGKTTLLLACGAMLNPTSGCVQIKGNNIFALSPGERTTLRSNNIGYLFQTLELIPYLTVLDNVCIGKQITMESAKHWLTKLGIEDKLAQKPECLSHGQRQRVALARAIAHQPDLVIADEPTGNLDESNSRIVFEALREYANLGNAVLIASHDSSVCDLADQTMTLESKVVASKQTS